MQYHLQSLIKTKYIGINLTKHVQNLCAENYTRQMKEVKDLNKWWDITYSWIGRINIVKIWILFKITFKKHLSKLQQDCVCMHITCVYMHIHMYIHIGILSTYIYTQNYSKIHVKKQSNLYSWSNFEKEV